MADDYYSTLGIGRSASADEIRKAYRELARKYHPDLNADDAGAKKKFQDVQAAFDVLNDSKKREMYDRYGPNFEAFGGGPGRAGGAGGRQPWGATGGPGGGQSFHFDFEDLFGQPAAGQTGPQVGGGFADLFRNLGGGGGRGGKRGRPVRGNDIEHELMIPFNTAVLGGEARIAVERPDGRVEEITVKIPVGIEDGKRIRLRGQGEPGPRGNNGDLLIRVHVSAHPYFTRRGKRLEVRLPVTLAEAIAGAKVDVPTPKGTITLQIPPGTSSGKKLRIRGHGVAPNGESPGDLYAEVQIMLPENLSDEDRRKITEASSACTMAPRAKLKW